MRPPRPTYPGTNIPILRGGAPDPPAADPKPAAQAAPAGGGSPPAAGGDPKPVAKPDGSGAAPSSWETEKADYQKRLGAYERFGKPEEIDTFVTQARTNKAQLDRIYEDFKDGKISYAQAQQKAEQVAQPADPFDGYDDLQPREQAQRLIGVMKREFEDFTKTEMAKIAQAVQSQSASMSTQMKLAWKLMDVARKNPDVSLDDIIAGSTEQTAYSPEQIIDLQVHRMSEPQRIKLAADKAVAEARAEWQRELDAKKVPLTTRTAPRLVTRPKTDASPAEARDRVFGNFMDRLNRAAGGGSES